MPERQAELRTLHKGRAQPRAQAPAFDAGEHRPEHVTRAIAGWQSLLDGERDSFVAASMIAADLGRLGAPDPLLAEACKVVEDEARHVLVAGTVVRALGGTPTSVAPEKARADLGSGTIRERLVRTLVAGFVVGESLSAAGFAVARERATVPLVRWAYDELLKDEATHGGFGERAGAWLMEGWDTASREALWPACVREMQYFESLIGGPLDDDKLARDAANPDLPALIRLGLVPRTISVPATLAGLERWALPRLRRLGVVPATP